MKKWGRRKQSILCGSIVWVCIIALWQLKIQVGKIETQMLTEQDEETPMVVTANEDKPMSLDIASLFEYHLAQLTEEEIQNAVGKLLGSSYLSEVQLQSQNRPYLVRLKYFSAKEDISFSRVNKDQLALVNAVCLMSLFEELDTVSVTVTKGSDIYEKVFYKPDIEDYFGVAISAINDQKTFERLALEFMDMDKVNAYWNGSHPYDSQLGEDAEKFFKEYFACEQGEQLLLPVGQEEVEETLRTKYSYQLYIEGLNYDNANINYYCANKLVSYYGSSNMEDILLELVACRNKSMNDKIQETCDEVMDILTYKEEVPYFFSLFHETEGDSILYGIINEKYREFASWQGTAEGSIELISLSDNDDYVLCEAAAGHNRYMYCLPIDSKGTYNLQEDAAVLEDHETFKELYSLVRKNETSDKCISGEWLYGPFIKLIAEDKYVYDCDKQNIQTLKHYERNFSYEQLFASFEGHDVLVLNNEENSRADCHITQLAIDGEQIIVYEFATATKRENVVKRKDSLVKAYYLWNKGKIAVGYNGSKSNILHLISQIMKKE